MTRVRTTRVPAVALLAIEGFQACLKSVLLLKSAARDGRFWAIRSPKHEHATTRLEAPQKHRWTAECGKTTDASGASSAVIDWGGAFQMVDSRGPALELSRPFWYSRSRLAQDAAVLAASKRQLAVECRVRPRLVDSMTISADLPKVNVSFAIQTGSGLQRAKPYTTSDSFALLACSGWMTGSNARQPTSLCCLAFPMRSCG